jgi:hypothetical protein
LSSRYSFAPPSVVELLDDVIKERFFGLTRARFLVLFDEKKRMRLGAYVLAQVRRAQDVVRLVYEQAEGVDCDYVLSLDKEVWLRIEKADRVRILRHELRHCWEDTEAKDQPWKLVGHEIEDFHAEVALNADNPQWAQRLATVADAIYEADIKPAIPDERQEGLFESIRKGDVKISITPDVAKKALAALEGGGEPPVEPGAAA